MPHKRAKLSARRAQRDSTGVDLAPTGDQSKVRDMPHSAMAIFCPPPRRKADEEAKGADDAGDDEMRIRPGEKLSAFNRCVVTDPAASSPRMRRA